METQKKGHHESEGRDFQTFLSGMETGVQLSGGLSHSALSDLPIRDGNLLCGGTLTATGRFQTFLSGMETCDEPHPLRLPHPFRPSYQGWKQVQPPERVLVGGLSDLPIRDGNLICSSALSTLTRFQTFLSGMETKCPPLIPLPPRSLSDLPIRDGNILNLAKLLRHHFLSDLPIRDGNLSPQIGLLSKEVLSDLPIRDGNLKWFGGIALTAYSFRPSYQGWKLENDFFCTKLCFAFRPSYQGWKPGTPAGSTTSPKAFRPSYQGWKPRHNYPPIRISKLSDLPIRDGNPVQTRERQPITGLSDLPIRDGNASSPSPGTPGSPFQTFLSGMETRLHRQAEPARLFLSDLPIRDGNVLRSMAIAIPITLSDLPIRDGNRIPLCPSCVSHTSFRPSYQGWKLRSGGTDPRFRWLSDLPIRDGNKKLRSHVAKAFCFQTFLSGMETPIAAPRHRVPANFQTFLSGMETARQPPNRNADAPFRPSYQGWKLDDDEPGIPARAAFRPSYQGWKRPLRLRPEDLWFAFRPSYQGWKLEAAKQAEGYQALSDLPIRDGNPSRHRTPGA